MRYIHFILLFLCIGYNSQAQTIIYVDANATGLSNGSNWANAYTDLQIALAASVAGNQIWVAQGTYTPTNTPDRTVSFAPKSGTKIYGGFAGSETSTAERTPLNPTILSGDIGVAGDSTDNSYNVVYLFEPDSNTVLDGLVVQMGNANAPQAPSFRDRTVCGGGLYVMALNGDGYPTIKNCTFRNNTAKNYGGGICMHGGGPMSSLGSKVIGCLFYRNTAILYGGGLFIYGGSLVERGDDIRDCSFIQNTAVRGGGLYYFDYNGTDRFDLKNCIFDSNLASAWGGGAHFAPSRTGLSAMLIDSCHFISNRAKFGAALDLFPLTGAIYNGKLGINYCVFEQNTNFQGGANTLRLAIIATNTALLSMTHNRFFMNETDGSIVAIIEFSDADVEFMHNDMWAEKGTILFTDIDTALVSYSHFYSQHSLPISISVEKLIFSNSTSVGYEYYNSVLLYISSEYSYTKILMTNSLIWVPGSSGRFAVTNQDTIKVVNSILNKLAYNYSPSAFIVFKNSYIEGFDCNEIPNQVKYYSCENVISAPPLFRDTSNNDFTLLPCSPLINAGTNSVIAPGDTDIDGHPRIQGGTVDIGPYESGVFALTADPPEIQRSCTATPSGSIAVHAINGCEPYTYNWIGPSGAGSGGTGLAAGNYTLTLTDGKNETVVLQATVPSVPSPEVSLHTTPVFCGTTIGGTATPTVTSNNPPFQFLWSGGTADSIAANLAYGSYALTVADATGCTAFGTANIGRMGTIQVSIQPTNISCYNSNDGSIAIQPTNGAAPFHWLWTTGDTLPLLSGLGTGFYSGMLMDALGCGISWNIPLDAPDSLRTNPVVTPATGANIPDGRIVLSPTGGTGNIQALWSDGQQGWSVTGLLPGTYTVTLTDDNGCTQIEEIIVNWSVATLQPATVQAQVRVWPNPASEWLWVSYNEVVKGAFFQLFDINGRLLRQIPITEQTGLFSVSLGDLPSGAYIWRLAAGRGVVMVAAE